MSERHTPRGSADYSQWPRYETDRKGVSSEGTIGGPCHAVTASGHFCTRKAVAIADDGYGYCKTHAR